jgi:hypothetical protein
MAKSGATDLPFFQKFAIDGWVTLVLAVID